MKSSNGLWLCKCLKMEQFPRCQVTLSPPNIHCEGLWWQNVGIGNGLTHRTYYFRGVRMQLMMWKVCRRPHQRCCRSVERGRRNCHTLAQIQIVLLHSAIALKWKQWGTERWVYVGVDMCVCVLRSVDYQGDTKYCACFLVRDHKPGCMMPGVF